MPEGHTIHRLARQHNRLLVGHPVRASSPQGRFAAGAARIDGQVLERTDAYGKHLLPRPTRSPWCRWCTDLHGSAAGR